MLAAPQDAVLEPLADVLAAARKGSLGPVVVFPEGTTSNGLSVMSFAPVLEQVDYPAGTKVQLIAFKCAASLA